MVFRNTICSWYLYFSIFNKKYELEFKDLDILEKYLWINLIAETIFYTNSTHKEINANKYENEILTSIKEIWKTIFKKVQQI